MPLIEDPHYPLPWRALPWPNTSGLVHTWAVHAGLNLDVGYTVAHKPEGVCKAVAKAVNHHDALLTLLCDNLSAWEDEEESVKGEHAELIERTRKLVDSLTP